MTFKDWQMYFQSYSDDVMEFMGVAPATLNDWKTFVRDYRKSTGRTYVSSVEVVLAYYRQNPQEKLVGDLTVTEFKAL